MADKKEETVEVPQSTLTKMQEQMAELERKVEEGNARNEGIEEILAKNASTNDDKKLRDKKDFTPKFRTVRMRKYPIAGDETNLGWVIGWTNKGAYQEVDRSGVSPQIIDFIDIFFLGNERTEGGKLKAEKVRLLDLMNKGQQVHCKILESKREDVSVGTGEEIDVSIWDPAHGLVTTGEKVDGYSVFSEIKYKIQIPGVAEPVWVDALYANS